MTIQAWHFIPSDGLMAKPCGARNRHVAIVEGKTYRVKPPLYLWSHGLHASIRVLDALQYAQSSLLCRVEVSGEIVHGPDKLCATNRKVLAIRDIAPILHAFACDAAEEALIIAKVERTPENAWMAKTIDELKIEMAKADVEFIIVSQESAEVGKRYAAARKASEDAYEAYHDAVERERNLAHPGHPVTEMVQQRDRSKR